MHGQQCPPASDPLFDLVLPQQLCGIRRLLWRKAARSPLPVSMAQSAGPLRARRTASKAPPKRRPTRIARSGCHRQRPVLHLCAMESSRSRETFGRVERHWRRHPAGRNVELRKRRRHRARCHPVCAMLSIDFHCTVLPALTVGLDVGRSDVPPDHRRIRRGNRRGGGSVRTTPARGQHCHEREEEGKWLARTNASVIGV